jgi:hemolysin III
VQAFLSNPKRVQSQGEEIANSFSHGIGLLGALIGTPFLFMHALGTRMPDSLSAQEFSPHP